MSIRYMTSRYFEKHLRYLQTPESVGWVKPIIDWLIRLAVVGICASTYKACRSHFGSWKSVRKVLFPTTLVYAGGAYNWISSYVYQDPDVQRQFRDRIIVAEDEEGYLQTHQTVLRLGARSQTSITKSKFQTWNRAGVVAMVRPINNQDLLIRFQNRNIWVTKHGTAGVGGTVAYWSITTWFWNRDLVDELILAAHKMFYEKTDKEIHIYNHLLGSATWSGPLRRPTRAWDSVILPATTKESLLKDVEQFVSEDEKAWYALKGIPHRRGYLLHGPPGTGKTTLATAVASKLRLNMYCVSPAAAGMNNSKLERLFQTCPPGSLLFIEDFDCVMPHKRVAGVTNSAAIEAAKAQVKSNDKSTPPSSVTLSGLLNAIDGVASQEDSVLFASTNFPENLDAALRRPGRFDVDLKFDFATHEQAVQIYKNFYGPIDPPSNTCDVDNSTATHEDTEKSRLDDEADYFTDTIAKADIEVSIATIQGFLLLYKREPEIVQEKVAEWVEEVKTEQYAHIEGKLGVSENDREVLANLNVEGGGVEGIKTIKLGEPKTILKPTKKDCIKQKQAAVLL